MLHQPAGQPAQGAVVTQVHLSPATSQALGLMDGVTTLISPSVHRRRSAGARGIQCDSFPVVASNPCQLPYDHQVFRKLTWAGAVPPCSVL